MTCVDLFCTRNLINDIAKTRSSNNIIVSRLILDYVRLIWDYLHHRRSVLVFHCHLYETEIREQKLTLINMAHIVSSGRPCMLSLYIFSLFVPLFLLYKIYMTKSVCTSIYFVDLKLALVISSFAYTIWAKQPEFNDLVTWSQ